MYIKGIKVKLKVKVPLRRLAPVRSLSGLDVSCNEHQPSNEQKNPIRATKE